MKIESKFSILDLNSNIEIHKFHSTHADIVNNKYLNSNIEIHKYLIKFFYIL